MALVGFGHVGRRFAELLPGPYARALRAAGLRVVITGVATGRHGLAIDPRGLRPADCLALIRRGGSLSTLHRGAPLSSTLDLIRCVPADVLVELTPLDPRRGEPAVSHVRAALRRSLHVVTANKGPAAFALRPLRALARRRGRLFLHESAVMDGAPLFNLVERCLPGVRVRVSPERLSAADPLAGAGSDSALVLETDLMGEIVLVERGGTVDQTAYGVLSDLLAVAGATGIGPAARGAGLRPRT